MKTTSCRSATLGLTAMLVFLTAAVPSRAQTTNLALFQEMAIECIGDLPSEIDRLELDAPDDMPYVRSALVEAWQADGRDVYFDQTDASVVAYRIDEASVSYARRDGAVGRDVGLTLRYTITDVDGRVRVDDRCTLHRTDTLQRRHLAAVESEAYPETQAEALQAGWFRRVIEPAVLTAATAVAVYLFFTLRSAGGDDA